jgi:hypothetical protein
LDLNCDGKLEDAEVTNVAYVCNGGAGSGADGGGLTLQGDYTIDNSLDVQLLAPYSKITGNLSVNAKAGTTITLPNLVEVGGSIQLMVTNGGPPVLATLSLPALTKVDSFVVNASPKLVTLDAPVLTTLGSGTTSGLDV